VTDQAVEPLPEWDPMELVRCPKCEGRKVLTRERRGDVVSRACPTCGGRGQVLLGNPPDSPYEITFDFCERRLGCCRAEIRAGGTA
jgi:hypothetical protein